MGEAVRALQDEETGLWHTVLDHSETYLEGSVSLMFGDALMRAGRLNLLNERQRWRA